MTLIRRAISPRALALVALAFAAAPAVAQSSPVDALKAGERACYGVKLGGADAAKLAKGAVTTAHVELHREQSDSGSVVWGALHVRLKGGNKTAFVKDGCEKQPDGALKCSIACDGGTFIVSSAGGDAIALAVSGDGVRVRTCGSSLKQLGTALLTPANIAPIARLTPRPASECRTPMARFEKLLEAEEAAID